MCIGCSGTVSKGGRIDNLKKNRRDYRMLMLSTESSNFEFDYNANCKYFHYEFSINIKCFVTMQSKGNILFS